MCCAASLGAHKTLACLPPRRPRPACPVSAAALTARCCAPRCRCSRACQRLPHRAAQVKVCGVTSPEEALHVRMPACPSSRPACSCAAQPRGSCCNVFSHHRRRRGGCPTLGGSGLSLSPAGCPTLGGSSRQLGPQASAEPCSCAASRPVASCSRPCACAMARKRPLDNGTSSLSSFGRRRRRARARARRLPARAPASSA